MLWDIIRAFFYLFNFSLSQLWLSLFICLLITFQACCEGPPAVEACAVLLVSAIYMILHTDKQVGDSAIRWLQLVYMFLFVPLYFSYSASARPHDMKCARKLKLRRLSVEKTFFHSPLHLREVYSYHPYLTDCSRIFVLMALETFHKK